MNPFLQLQTQLRAVLAAHAWFADAPILTEELAALEAGVEAALGKLGFCAVITTARGTRLGDDEPAPLVLAEELTIALIGNPLMDSARNVLAALAAAIDAIEEHNRAHLAATAAVAWKILGHDYVEETADGIVTHHLRVSTTLRL